MPFFGGGGGGTGGGPYTVITTTSTLESQKSYMVDTSSSAYTVTLPATPANGDYVEIFDRANSFGTNNLTIDRNGNKIESLTENLTGNVNGAAFKLAYADSTTGWQVIPFYGFAGPNFVGATTSTAGVAGVVPAPAAGKNTRALFSDASFVDAQMYPRRAAETTRVVRNFTETLSPASASWNAKIRYFGLVYMYASANINQLKTRTGTGTISSAFNINLALWDCDEDGQPSTYVVGGNITSGTASNTDITLSVTSTPVTRGWYFVSVTPETNAPPSSLTAQSNGNSISIMYMGAQTLTNTTIMWNYTATTYDQTTHETFVRTAGVNPPNVGVVWT